MNAQFNAHGVELGQRYVSDAVVDDGTPFPPYTRDPELHYHPTTHPGAALPHAWLGRDTHDVSTLDLCAYDRFTLITGAAGSDWEAAALAVGDELGVEIRPFRVALGQEHNDVLGTWTRTPRGDRPRLRARPAGPVRGAGAATTGSPIPPPRCARRCTRSSALDLPERDRPRPSRTEGALR